MIKAEDILDTYQDGAFIRNWVLVGGYPRCVEDAVLVADLTAAGRDTQLAATAAVRTRIADLEGYVHALPIAGRSEPPSKLPTANPDTGEALADNPDHAAWLAAVAVVDEVSAATAALLAERSGGNE